MGEIFSELAIVYLLAGVPAPGDDGDTADLEELHLVRRAVVLVGEVGLGCSVGWEVWNRGVIFSSEISGCVGCRKFGASG